MGRTRDDRDQVPATANGAAGYLAAAVSLYLSSVVPTVPAVWAAAWTTSSSRAKKSLTNGAVDFMGTDAFAAAVSGVAGLVTQETFIALLLLLPPMAFGALIGNRRFLQTNPDRFRLAALLLLAGLAGVNLARVVL